MPSYKPTVYEQIVTDFWNNPELFENKDLSYDKYKKELAERGFADKRYFDAYVEDMRFIRDMMLKDGFNRELAEKISGKYFNADETAQIFKVITDKKEIDFEGLKEVLLEKGYTKKQLSSFTDDMNSVQKLIKNPKFNLRLAADIVKNYHPSNNKDVLRYALFDKEKQIVLEAEKMGMFQDGEVIEYDGYKRKIEAHDYLNLPDKADAFVIFSGHPGSAEPAMEAWFEDYKRTGKAKKLIFLGLYDNQGNTDFSHEDLEFNTGSEVEMYVRYCRECGISEEIIKECLVTPNDTSTEENTALLAEIRNKYFAADKEVNFVMFGYPAYQKRIASEFSFKFQEMEDAGKVAPSNFIMPVVQPEQREAYRYLSYDNLDGIALDIILSNCMAHPYRVSVGGRFDSKLGEYPERFKPYLPLGLVYSYPNVANELAGTDTDVATVMKLLRAIQDKAYGWEDAKKVDNTITYNVLTFRKRMARKGMLSAEVAFHGNKQSKEQNLKAIAATTHSYEDEAKIIMGSDTVSPKKLQGVVKYLQHENTVKEK
ncbi:MAG: hypothetical protein IJS88_05795 [Alphaproteobacteria bacterium]|nr:hypothetical protein [Alphaproteobacteria bacterium]